MSRAPFIGVGCLLVAVGLSASAWAAAKAPSAPRRVELVVSGAADAEGIERFETALRGALASKHLGLASAHKDALTPEDVVLAISASPDEAASIVARVFLDFSAAGHATLFLIDPRRGRIHVRHVTLDHGFDAVAREGTLFVIEQSLDAILEGREIGVSREEYQRSLAPPPAVASPAPAVASPPPAPPAIERGMPLWVAVGYDGVALGAGAFQHAAKLVLAAELGRVQLAIGARVAAPVSVAGGAVDARLETGGLSVSAAATLFTAGKLAVRAGLGAGLDATRVEPATTASDLQAAAAFWAAGPLLRGFAEVDRRFGALSLSLSLGAEAHLLDERYTVVTGNSTRDVFVPRRVRPEAALLIGWVF